MTFNRPGNRNSVFSGSFSRPTHPSSNIADIPNPEQDQPQATSIPAALIQEDRTTSTENIETTEPIPPDNQFVTKPASHVSLPADPPAGIRRADILCLSDLQPQPIEWLWQDRLAAGTLAMLSGDPGAGKTWVALAIAAALSRGRAPFTGEALEPCTVLYASMLKAGSEMVHARFAKLDGDAARLVLLRGAVTADSDQPASLHLRDTSILEDALARTQARLLIIDPLHSYFGSGVDPRHPRRNSVLDSLALLADRLQCCILFVRHLGKRGAARGESSIELSAAVRTEFLAGSSPDAPSLAALVHVKSNLGRLSPSLGYQIDEDGQFAWTGLSKLTPEALRTDRPTGAGLPTRKFVGEWLRQTLQNGIRSQYSIELDARRDGVSIATLRRSKFDLGVQSLKDGKTGSWSWSLPPAEPNHPARKRAR